TGSVTATNFDLDPTAKVMTLSVNSVNDAPISTVTTANTGIKQGTTRTLTLATFGFTDPNDNPSNQLANVLITPVSLNNASNGTLSYQNSPVIAPITVSLVSLNAGDLKYIAG